MAKAKYHEGQLRAYWNLHKYCYSVQEYIKGKGWRLKGHYNSIVIDYAYGEVSQAVRNRVITEKKKYVHAWLYGNITLLDSDKMIKESKRVVSYNPFKYDCFKVFNLNGLEVADLNLYHNPSIYCKVVDDKPQMYLSFE